MQATNQDLRQQRELIVEAQSNVNKTDAQVNRTGKLVDQMTRSEYYSKLAMFAAIALLFVADVWLFITMIIP